MDDKGLTVADALALKNSDNSNGWNDGGAWWIIILILFLIGGIGGYGNRGGGGNDAPATPTTVVVPTSTQQTAPTYFPAPATAQGVNDAFNFNSLSNGLDSIQTNLSNGFAANNLATSNLATSLQSNFGQSALQISEGINGLNRGIDNSTSAIQNSLCNGFNNVQSTIADTNYNLSNQGCQTRESIMQSNFNTLSGFTSVNNAIASNACDIARGQDDIRYLLAQNQSQTTNNIDALGDRLIDYMNQAKMDELRSELQSARFQISQQAQTENIVNTLLPTPRPAYITASPYQSYGANAACACGM